MGRLNGSANPFPSAGRGERTPPVPKAAILTQSGARVPGAVVHRAAPPVSLGACRELRFSVPPTRAGTQPEKVGPCG